MSDFDREAEREKLREQFEQDKEKREVAEQMSELLLQGATMTNQHCPACHSPIFRYDGQQFCPSCQREITEDGEFADEAGEGSVDTATNGEATDTATGHDSEGEPASGERTSADEADDAAPQASAARGTPSQREPDATRESREAAASGTDRERPADAGAETPPDTEPETRPAPARERSPARIDPPARRETPPNDGRARAEGAQGRGRTGADDLREAEAALIREIAALTRQAEGTRDVGRKRDLFAAANEAAETLQTIRRL